MDAASKPVSPAAWGCSPKPRMYTAEEWQRQYTIFKQLYFIEGHSLLDVIETMAKRYGFYATEDQCRKRLVKWGFETKPAKDTTREKRKKRKMVDGKPVKGDKRAKGETPDGFQIRFLRPMLALPAERIIPPPAEQKNGHPASATPSRIGYWPAQNNNDGTPIQYASSSKRGANTPQSTNFSQPPTMATSYIPEQPVHLDRPYSHDMVVQNTASPAVQNTASPAVQNTASSAVHNTAPSTSYSQHDSHVIPYPRCQMAGGSGVDNTTPSVPPLDPNSVGGHLDTLPADIGNWGLFTGGIDGKTVSDTLEFEEIECLQTLYQHAKRSLESTTDAEFQDAVSLIGHLGYNSLAIKLAGAYIAKHPGESFAGYMPLYFNSLRTIISQVPRETTAYDSRCAIAAFEISFSAVVKENVQAAETLLMCAFLHHDNIFDDLIWRGLLQQSSTGMKIELLLSYALIDRLPAGDAFSIHLSVHSWLRERLDPETGERKLEDAAQLVANLVMMDYRQGCGEAFGRRVLPHLEACWQYAKLYLQSATGAENWYIVNSVASMGFGFSYQGRTKEAEEVDIRVVAIQKKVLGETHPDTLVSMSCLAWTYLKQGRWKEADDLGGKAVKVAKRALGVAHPDTLDSMTTFAAIIKEQGRWKEAETIEAEVLSTGWRMFGEAHSSNLAPMCNLAWTFSRQGRWKEAEDLGVQTVSMLKELRGEAHKHTLRASSNLARTVSRQGRWKEAVQLEGAVLDIKKKVFGDVHPDTLESIGNLAWTFSRQGLWMEAEDLQVQLLATRIKVLGQTHPDTLDSISNLAWTISRQGRLGEAEELQIGVLTTKKEVLGEAHPDTLVSMIDLAWLFSKQLRWKEAENLGVQVIELAKKELGEIHPDTLRSISNLAWVLSGQERWEEAEQLGVQVVEMMKRELGETHPGTLESITNLAWIFSGQGRWKDAEDLGVHVVALMKKELGEGHPDTVESMSKLKMYQITRFKARKDLLQPPTAGDEHVSEFIG